jgi:hypothetical protein
MPAQWQGKAGEARLGTAGHGEPRQGTTRLGKAGMAEELRPKPWLFFIMPNHPPSPFGSICLVQLL